MESGWKDQELKEAIFYENYYGNLESCVLYEPVTIADSKCKQDGLISFYIDGKLKSCVKPDNWKKDWGEYPSLHSGLTPGRAEEAGVEGKLIPVEGDLFEYLKW